MSANSEDRDPQRLIDAEKRYADELKEKYEADRRAGKLSAPRRVSAETSEEWKAAWAEAHPPVTAAEFGWQKNAKAPVTAEEFARQMREKQGKL